MRLILPFERRPRLLPINSMRFHSVSSSPIRSICRSFSPSTSTCSMTVMTRTASTSTPDSGFTMRPILIGSSSPSVPMTGRRRPP